MVSTRGTKRTERRGGLKTGRRQPAADAGTSSPAQGTALENSLRDELSMFREQNKGQCGWGREAKGSVLQEEQGPRTGALSRKREFGFSSKHSEELSGLTVTSMMQQVPPPPQCPHEFGVEQQLRWRPSRNKIWVITQCGLS